MTPMKVIQIRGKIVLEPETSKEARKLSEAVGQRVQLIPEDCQPATGSHHLDPDPNMACLS
ncbi:hypothetical protein ACSQ76_08305 [Roseovarius sp. B08]|uniref:hypothetical protein n=1 Tax=Roseovarius sp. B08 TaxID=3449223 RepID=UPI003EDBD87E